MATRPSTLPRAKPENIIGRKIIKTFFKVSRIKSKDAYMYSVFSVLKC
jgi:hypothetical protein